MQIEENRDHLRGQPNLAVPSIWHFERALEVKDKGIVESSSTVSESRRSQAVRGREVLV